MISQTSLPSFPPQPRSPSNQQPSDEYDTISSIQHSDYYIARSAGNSFDSRPYQHQYDFAGSLPESKCHSVHEGLLKSRLEKKLPNCVRSTTFRVVAVIVGLFFIVGIVVMIWAAATNAWGSAPLAFSIDPTAANHETTVTSTDVTITVISEMTTSSTDLSAGPTNRTRYGTTISPETTTMGNSVTTSLLSTSFPTTLSDTPPTTIGTTKPPSTGETPLKTSPSEVTTTVTEKAETTSTTTSETTMLPSTVTERTTLKTSPSETTTIITEEADTTSAPLLTTFPQTSDSTSSTKPTVTVKTSTPEAATIVTENTKTTSSPLMTTFIPPTFQTTMSPTIEITTTTSPTFHHCSDIKKFSSAAMTGIYKVIINGIETEVLCDMTTLGGGWTVVQQRLSNSDFDKSWEDYQIGFGSISETEDFWLGNERLHWLTNSFGRQSLRIELEPCDPGFYCNNATNQIAEFITYDQARIGDETSSYSLTIGSVSVLDSNKICKLQDSLNVSSYITGVPFVTADRKVSQSRLYPPFKSCGGWWYSRTSWYGSLNAVVSQDCTPTLVNHAGQLTVAWESPVAGLLFPKRVWMKLRPTDWS